MSEQEADAAPAPHEVNLWGVQASEVQDMWALVQDMIGEALERGGSHTLEEVLDDITSGRGQLWAAWSHEEGILGCMITFVVPHPLKTVCRIWMCVGRERKRWVHHLATIEAWAKEAGCTSVIAVVRPGWEKVLTDYRKTHVTLERTI